MAEEYEVRGIPSYTDKDTWVRVMAGGMVKIGITDYAQKMLKEIMFVDLPDVGSEVVQMQPFVSVESTKELSDVYSPVSGTVKAVNDDVPGDPGVINRDPYEGGWLVAVAPSNLEEEMKNLLSADAYKELIREKIGK